MVSKFGSFSHLLLEVAKTDHLTSKTMVGSAESDQKHVSKSFIHHVFRDTVFGKARSRASAPETSCQAKISQKTVLSIIRFEFHTEYE